MTNEEKRKVHKEKRETRMAIFPYLEAERDNILVKELKSAYAKEKEIILKIANLVAEYVEKCLYNVKVVYTPTDDSFLSLDERVALANGKKAD